jgi:hypothetical protein
VVARRNSILKWLKETTKEKKSEIEKFIQSNSFYEFICKIILDQNQIAIFDENKRFTEDD